MAHHPIIDAMLDSRPGCHQQPRIVGDVAGSLRRARGVWWQVQVAVRRWIRPKTGQGNVAQRVWGGPAAVAGRRHVRATRRARWYGDVQ